MMLPLAVDLDDEGGGGGEAPGEGLRILGERASPGGALVLAVVILRQLLD